MNICACAPQLHQANCFGCDQSQWRIQNFPPPLVEGGAPLMWALFSENQRQNGRIGYQLISSANDFLSCLPISAITECEYSSENNGSQMCCKSKHKRLVWRVLRTDSHITLAFAFVVYLCLNSIIHINFKRCQLPTSTQKTSLTQMLGVNKPKQQRIFKH